MKSEEDKVEFIVSTVAREIGAIEPVEQEIVTRGVNNSGDTVFSFYYPKGEVAKAPECVADEIIQRCQDQNLPDPRFKFKYPKKEKTLRVLTIRIKDTIREMNWQEWYNLPEDERLKWVPVAWQMIPVAWQMKIYVTKSNRNWPMAPYELLTKMQGALASTAWREGISVRRACDSKKYVFGQEVKIPRHQEGGPASKFKYYFLTSYRSRADMGAFRLMRSDGKLVSSADQLTQVELEPQSQESRNG